MNWRSATSLRVLVTVKAYPEIGKKHGETVCVAGVRVDTTTPSWVRLYPVPFRDLPRIRQFKKYQFVELRATRPPSDRRPESWRVDPDAIVVGESLDTSTGWNKRRPYIEPLIIESMCELQRRQQTDGTSLGAFRPSEVIDVEVSRAKGWSEGKLALAAQGRLLGDRDRVELEPIPWEFRYHYRCSTSGCNTHKQRIIDWELGQAWRKRSSASEQERVEKVRSKWLNELANPDKDVVFFAGNMASYPRSFLVLGVYYPPQIATAQQLLF